MATLTISTRWQQQGSRQLLTLFCCLAISGVVDAYPIKSSLALNDNTPHPPIADTQTADLSNFSINSGNPINVDGTEAMKAQDSLAVTFVNPGLRGERFWDMVTDTMQAAAHDLNITLKVVYAKRNPFLLKKLALQALEDPTPPDYLVLVNEEQAASELLKTSDSYRTRVVMLLNGLTREQEQVHGSPGTIHPAWIGSVIPDNYTAGKRMANQLIKEARQVSPTGQLRGLALIGDTLTPASIARNSGMLAGFAQDEAFQLDRIIEARWNTQDAQHLTGKYLKWTNHSNGQNDLVWAANDAMAEGAILAIESAGLTPGKDVLVAGLNWSPEGISMVSDRRLLLTDGGHFMAGAWSMVMVRDHATIEGWVPRTVNFPMSAITHDNVELYGPLLKTPDWRSADFKAFGLQESQGVYDFDPMTVLIQMIGQQEDDIAQ
ncbi:MULTISPECIES: ABC transporter substrate-binding protein [Cobetia]|uniref:ABC transporter substrate-binding protein n=1 Tax=Cobetia TaxID=204286 RepID=UPI000A0723A8|nr:MULTISPECIES: ABC transporter substrate-binding protein [Cobetia]MDH2298008.1 ABC transporter substrate-binding protein [Cobetia sp. 29-18-1]